MAVKKKLTKAQMRVAIARDVIAQIESQKLRFVTGAGYIQTPASLAKNGTVKSGRKCSVCALGAAAIARWNLFNECKWELHWGESLPDWNAALKGIFPRSDMDRIERAFECGYSGIRIIEDRAIAIMQNIIDHGGTFKPEVEYEIIQ